MAAPVRHPSGNSVGSKGNAAKADLIRKTFVIPIKYSDGTSETDTSYTLPDKAVVRDVFVNVRTAEATGGTKTIDVGTNTSGTSDDPDGFLDGVDVSSTGLVGNTLDSAGQTRGALLRDDEDGAGALVPASDYGSGGAVISWTPGSGDFAELEAEIVVDLYEYRDQ